MPAPDGAALSALSWPAPAGRPAVLIVHGWASRAANHADFARRCAERGWAVLAPDLRGHGRSGGSPGPEMLEDLVRLTRGLRRSGHPRVGLRGSSLGGFLALHTAARTEVAAVAAICPARSDRLAELLGDDWPRRLPLQRSVARRDGVARGYWHATGDDRVGWGTTRALSELTPHPMRLRVALGGSHTSLQHDGAVQHEVVEFLGEHLEP